MMNDSRFTIKKSMSPKKAPDRAHLIEGGGNGEVAADDSRFPGATSGGGSGNSYGAVQPDNYGIQLYRRVLFRKRI